VGGGDAEGCTGDAVGQAVGVVVPDPVPPDPLPDPVPPDPLPDPLPPDPLLPDPLPDPVPDPPPEPVPGSAVGSAGGSAGGSVVGSGAVGCALRVTCGTAAPEVAPTVWAVSVVRLLLTSGSRAEDERSTRVRPRGAERSATGSRTTTCPGERS